MPQKLANNFCVLPRAERPEYKPTYFGRSRYDFKKRAYVPVSDHNIDARIVSAHSQFLAGTNRLQVGTTVFPSNRACIMDNFDNAVKNSLSKKH